MDSEKELAMDAGKRVPSEDEGVELIARHIAGLLCALGVRERRPDQLEASLIPFPDCANVRPA